VLFFRQKMINFDSLVASPFFILISFAILIGEKYVLTPIAALDHMMGDTVKYGSG